MGGYFTGGGEGQNYNSNFMIILSVDIGGVDGTGLVIYDSEPGKIMVSETFYSRAKDEGVIDFFVEVGGYAYRYSPDLILAPIPTAHRKTIARHYEKIGTLRVIAHQLQSKLIEVVDSNCKKLVLGEGNGSEDKEFIANFYKKNKKLKTEHERDAYMFIQAYETGNLKIK